MKEYTCLELTGEKEELLLIAYQAKKMGWQVQGKLRWENYTSLCFNFKNTDAFLPIGKFWTCGLDEDHHYHIIRDCVLNDKIIKLLKHYLKISNETLYPKKRIAQTL